MNELQIFENEEFGRVRTIEIDGKPYFVANDVARALGYTNPSKATNDHCKNAVMRRGNDSLGREQEFKFIPEGDVYRLIIRSNLPAAEKFESWVFDEVIPLIRKTGSYQLPNLSYAESLRMLADKVEENERLKLEVVQMNDKITEMQPKASYYDEILATNDTVLTTQIAKDYGMSAKGFNKKLHDLGVQFKAGDQWVLYSKYQGLGYTKSHTHIYTKNDGSSGSSMNTEWTQKGRLFLYDFLKQHNCLPLMERENESY